MPFFDGSKPLTLSVNESYGQSLAEDLRVNHLGRIDRRSPRPQQSLTMQPYYSAGAPTVPRHGGALQMGAYGSSGGMRSHAQSQTPQNKSRRLYVGNIPYHAGISENGMVQLFSALYVAGFRPLVPGEPLPVTSFWLHTDGKFGFMELRGDSEAVDVMQFNGLVLHGRPLRINRPSDFRPEMTAGSNLAPNPVNAAAVQELCNQLAGLVAPPSHIATAAAVAGSVPAQALGNVVPQNETNGHQPGLPPAAPAMPAFRSQPQNPTIARPQESAVIGHAQNPGIVAGPETFAPVVLSLRHLVSSEDVDVNQEDYDELVEDIRDECSKYGVVKEICIPRSGRGKGAAFISYATRGEAMGAAEQLRKRVFDGKSIEALIVENVTTPSAAAEIWVD
jgi:splicing factor U2AF 65 kDa subunit